jgi:hypothetical protein
MVTRKAIPRKPEKRRFTVTLNATDYEELQKLADGQSPPLPMTYVVNYAIKRLLEQIGDPQLHLVLGNPLRSKEHHG